MSFRRSRGTPAAVFYGLGRQFKTGLYYGPILFSGDLASAVTQDSEYAAAFGVGAATTFDRIGLEITTFAASNVVRLGIRHDAGGYPGAVLLDAGTIDASTNGFKEITISQRLPAGLWWVTATLQGGTGAQIRYRSLSAWVGSTLTSTNSSAGFIQTGVSGALGAFTATPASTSIGPKVLLRAA